MLRGECFKQTNITGPLFLKCLPYLGVFTSSFCKRVVREAELPDPFLPKCYRMTFRKSPFRETVLLLSSPEGPGYKLHYLFSYRNPLLPLPGSKIFLSLTTHHPPTNIPLFYVIVSVSIFLGMGRSPMTLFLSREEYSRDSFIHLQIFIEHLLSLGTVQSTEVAEVIKTKFSSAHFQTNGRDR